MRSLLIARNGLLSKICGSVSSNAVAWRTSENETGLETERIIIFCCWGTRDLEAKSTIFPLLLFKRCARLNFPPNTKRQRVESLFTLFMSAFRFFSFYGLNNFSRKNVGN